MLEKLNFNIPYTKNDGCVLINAKDWQDNTTQLIQAYNMKGEHCISYINKVLKVNSNKEIYGEEIVEGDLIFISKQASRISYLKPYKIYGEEGEYANVHLLQVIGKFENNTVSYDSFKPIYNKIFMKKVEVSSNSILDIDENKTVIGKVLKVGTNGFDKDWKPTPLTIGIGEYVLVRDNISTEILLDGEEYFATEDTMVVGNFIRELTFDDLNLYNQNILLEEYEEELIEGSSIFFKPITFDDVSENNKDNRFKIVKIGPNVKDVEVGDKVIADKDYMNYVTIEGKQYCLLDSSRYIYGKFN